MRRSTAFAVATAGISFLGAIVVAQAPLPQPVAPPLPTRVYGGSELVISPADGNRPSYATGDTFYEPGTQGVYDAVEGMYFRGAACVVITFVVPTT